MKDARPRAIARKRVYEHVSFVTIDGDSDEHELKGLDFFDVPFESYSEGNYTGMKACFEVLKEAASDDKFDGLPSILEEALKVLDEKYDTEDGVRMLGKRGAAVGFVSALEDIFIQAASELDFSKLAKMKLSYYEDELTDRLADMRKDNANIITGLAKRRSKSAPATQGAAA